MTDSWERARERIGQQQLYNVLLSHYLDARETEARDNRGPNLSRRNGQGDALVWAAMFTFDLDEAAASGRVAADLEERRVARAD